ncbi:hypothetical protein M433DRAFT_298829 [Acidomyces richmondensis BFW]|nr:MAG: hypothetical protein FE78DRAFT_475683 [Acidomyces sp. 'richmondensis']KYG49513.1 hypothetical protein M433DRAFT_298829 [Acidomyces richmondensis BFW]
MSLDTNSLALSALLLVATISFVSLCQDWRLSPHLWKTHIIKADLRKINFINM